ncbi:OLC1v1032567C1 [Oldenlandia corymbosa var. corymbosa]|uniref:OLC1v1032567C1 n=1 Tax=Oldenlandia corymbosa var. corymbosa TaxID=529605 RepID=A0AAV1CN30_OLDCO|nr:OLC1v1032567C1 [Oldenlandia corymbosa var. corymbosa]
MLEKEWVGAQEEDKASSSSRLLKLAALATAAIVIASWVPELSILAAGIIVSAWAASKCFGSAGATSTSDDVSDLTAPERPGVIMNRADLNFNNTSSEKNAESFSLESGRADRAVILKEIRPVRWVSPRTGWVKLNSDGSFVPGRGGTAGGLVRDERGLWLGGFVMNIGACAVSSTEAELRGLFEGLNMTWNLGFRNVIAEVDLESVINLVTNNHQRKPGGGALEEMIEAIRELSKRPWKLELLPISRKANSAADYLASLATDYQQGRVVKLYKFPPGVLPFLLRDIAGLP